MGAEIPRGKQAAGSADRLSERDWLLIETMLATNSEWLVVSHNRHLVSVQPVGRPLNASALPDWWLKYARANRLRITL